MRNPDTSQHNGIPKMKQALLIWIQLTHPTQLSTLHLGQWSFLFRFFSCLYVKPPVSGVLTAHCWCFNHHSPLVSSSSLKSSSSMAWKSATLLSPSPQSRDHSPDFVAGLWAINIYGGYIYIYIDLNTHYTHTHIYIYIYYYITIKIQKLKTTFPIFSNPFRSHDPFRSFLNYHQRSHSPHSDLLPTCHQSTSLHRPSLRGRNPYPLPTPHHRSSRLPEEHYLRCAPHLGHRCSIFPGLTFNWMIAGTCSKDKLIYLKRNSWGLSQEFMAGLIP